MPHRDPRAVLDVGEEALAPAAFGDVACFGEPHACFWRGEEGDEPEPNLCREVVRAEGVGAGERGGESVDGECDVPALVGDKAKVGG